MEKVEGSSPFICFTGSPAKRGFLVARIWAKQAWRLSRLFRALPGVLAEGVQGWEGGRPAGLADRSSFAVPARAAGAASSSRLHPRAGGLHERAEDPEQREEDP